MNIMNINNVMNEKCNKYSMNIMNTKDKINITFTI